MKVYSLRQLFCTHCLQLGTIHNSILTLKDQYTLNTYLGMTKSPKYLPVEDWD